MGESNLPTRPNHLHYTSDGHSAYPHHFGGTDQRPRHATRSRYEEGPCYYSEEPVLQTSYPESSQRTSAAAIAHDNEYSPAQNVMYVSAVSSSLLSSPENFPSSSQSSSAYFGAPFSQPLPRVFDAAGGYSSTYPSPTYSRTPYPLPSEFPDPSYFVSSADAYAASTENLSSYASSDASGSPVATREDVIEAPSIPIVRADQQIKPEPPPDLKSFQSKFSADPHTVPAPPSPLQPSSSYGKKKKRKSKMHPCQVCHKSFPRPSGLRTHMNTHNNVRPFKCPYHDCDRAFTVRSNAKRHMRIHGPLHSGLQPDPPLSPEPYSIIDFDQPVVATSEGLPQNRIQWIPESLSGRGDLVGVKEEAVEEEEMLTVKIEEVDETQVRLDPVVPSLQNFGGKVEGEGEERNSFAGYGEYPYHPEQFRSLPGPAIAMAVV